MMVFNAPQIVYLILGDRAWIEICLARAYASLLSDSDRTVREPFASKRSAALDPASRSAQGHRSQLCRRALRRGPNVICARPEAFTRAAPHRPHGARDRPERCSRPTKLQERRFTLGRRCPQGSRSAHRCAASFNRPVQTKQRRSTHLLQVLHQLLPSNPRQIKRIVNMIALYRPVPWRSRRSSGQQKARDGALDLLLVAIPRYGSDFTMIRASSSSLGRSAKGDMEIARFVGSDMFDRPVRKNTRTEGLPCLQAAHLPHEKAHVTDVKVAAGAGDLQSGDGDGSISASLAGYRSTRLYDCHERRQIEGDPARRVPWPVVRQTDIGLQAAVRCRSRAAPRIHQEASTARPHAAPATRTGREPRGQKKGQKKGRKSASEQKRTEALVSFPFYFRALCGGGGGWIRTSVGLPRRIYSPLHLTALPPLPRCGARNRRRADGGALGQGGRRVNLKASVGPGRGPGRCLHACGGRAIGAAGGGAVSRKPAWAIGKERARRAGARRDLAVRAARGARRALQPERVRGGGSWSPGTPPTGSPRRSPPRA